jgi:hypothetical protein
VEEDSKTMGKLDLRAHNELIADLYEMGISLESARLLEQRIGKATNWTPLECAVQFVEAAEYDDKYMSDGYNGKICNELGDYLVRI